jgi:hypothetical protein
MCQRCVADGHLTQDELDRRVAAGDITVTPVTELPLEQFLASVAQIMGEAIANGMPRATAYLLATAELDKYMDLRAAEGNPVTAAELDALPKSMPESAQWN